jgi:hypothetical protein
MKPKLTAEQIQRWGYTDPVQLKSGDWAALSPLLFTHALYVGMKPQEWDCRYCYETEQQARQALRSLIESGGTKEPEGWIAKR